MRSACLMVCVLIPLFHASAFAKSDGAYLAELIARARQLKLADKPEWLKLGHYVPDLVSSGVHGLVDSPQFYNAPDGKNNPQAELEATLASFYSDSRESNGQQNPQCLFIARYTWLKQQLGFDLQRLPEHHCERYQAWHAALNPGGLTMIFASAYLNSPASMYGHTLMRVDAKDQDEHTRLLAYAINFAANTDETNGVLFAMNGLFGGYPGAFSILPYYVKVREYRDMENRDLWEYQLNLSPEEVDRVLMHAWELGPTYFQYFFFDENCSYHLLGLLQVAKPDLDLTSRFRWWAIPTDTVREITRQPGLVKNVAYRPSSATIVQHQLSLLNESERRLTKGLSMGRVTASDPALSAIPVERAAAVLEASEDYLGYRRSTGRDDMADPAGLARELLTARSRLDVVSQTPEVPVPVVRPDQGHGSARLTLGVGRWEDRNYQEITARPAYHDLMDDDAGYTRGAQNEFFDLSLRHYDSSATEVERFIPVNIFSLTPRDDFFQPASWKVSAGWQRMRAANGGYPLVLSLDGGAGGAWSNPGDTALWYALIDSSSRVGSDLENGYALGAGARTGMLFDIDAHWRVHGYVRGMRYFLGQRDSPLMLGLEQRIAFGRDLALRIDASRNRELQRTYNNGSVSMLFYF
jgi:hypothetical protein